MNKEGKLKTRNCGLPSKKEILILKPKMVVYLSKRSKK
jgi:hypothetical protein